MLGAACLLALLAGGRRRARGTALRALGFAVLLLWLTGPLLWQETRQGLPDTAVVLVDRTASMELGDRGALRDAAVAALQHQAAAIPGLHLEIVPVPESGSHGTQLFAALNRALAGIPSRRLAGVIAVTDGQVHDVPDHLPDGVPLHVLIPAAGEQTDRRIRVIEAPGFGLVGETVTLHIAVDDLGVPHPDPAATLTITGDGAAPRTETVPVGRDYAVTIPITHAGPAVISLQAGKLPGAVTDLNSRAVITINGVRDRLRVLLVSGQPHPGERIWRRLLKSDPSIDLVHFTILRSPDKNDLTPTNELALIGFPVHELFQTKIKEFDLIILDRFQSEGLLPSVYLQNIADYVREGGALLIAAGPEFAGHASLSDTPIGAILPARPVEGDAVVEGQFRPLVTKAGARHPVTSGLSGGNDPAQADSKPQWGPWYRHLAVTVTSGDTLMTSEDGAPLLVFDRVERGRVALLLSDQIWLWARGHEGGGPQAELLRNIAHWTLQEPELEENALTARDEAGRLVVTQRTLADQPPAPVTVTAPDGTVSRLALLLAAPGVYRGSVAAAQPGAWQVSEGRNKAAAAVTAADPLEMADLRATSSVLSPLVRKSGGSVNFLAGARPPVLRRVEALSGAGGGVLELPRRHDSIITSLSAAALIPGWLAALLIMGLTLGAWWRERG